MVCLILGLIWVSGASAAEPSVESESVTGITEHNAVLNATINPGGLETTVQFHLQTEPCGGGGGCQSIVVYPLSSSSLDASSTNESVSLNLHDDEDVTLMAGTEYRYWVVASNSDGSPVKGAEHTFSTDPEPQPALEDCAGPFVMGRLCGTIHLKESETVSYYFLVNAGGPCSGGSQYGNDEATGEDIPVSVELTGLSPATTYHYCLVVTTSAGNFQSQDRTFSTPPIPPLIESESVSNLSPRNATLNAAIEPRSGQNALYQFQLAEDPSEFADEIQCPPPPSSGPFVPCIGTESVTALPIGSVCGECEIELAQPVHLDLAEVGITLQPGTTYYFRVLAANQIFSEDTVEWEGPAVVGDDQEFTTPEYPAPTVTTSAGATNIEQTSARVGGTVNPNAGYVTACKIEYGTTTSYGSEKACDSLPGEGNSPVAVISALSGLAIDTTYHYRLVATNVGGTSSGADQTFTTRPYYCAFSGGSATCSGGGPENPKPKPRKCKKGFVKKHGKCVKKHRKHRHHGHKRVHH